MSEQKQGTFKKIAAAKACKKIMADHFYELDEASKTGSRKIAWCTSVGPAELLRGMGFLVYFPENHGAMLGATRMATDLIPLCQCPRVFSRYLFLSHGRCGKLSTEKKPADHGVQY